MKSLTLKIKTKHNKTTFQKLCSLLRQTKLLIRRSPYDPDWCSDSWRSLITFKSGKIWREIFCPRNSRQGLDETPSTLPTKGREGNPAFLYKRRDFHVLYKDKELIWKEDKFLYTKLQKAGEQIPGIFMPLILYHVV